MSNVFKNIIDTFSHPETREGELFFLNTNTAGFENIRYNSKRKGIIAYDGEGNRQNAADWFPVFASIKEFEKSELQLVEERKKFKINN